MTRMRTLVIFAVLCGIAVTKISGYCHRTLRNYVAIILQSIYNLFHNLGMKRLILATTYRIGGNRKRS